jgi:hypothetical protein
MRPSSLAFLIAASLIAGVARFSPFQHGHDTPVQERQAVYGRVVDEAGAPVAGARVITSGCEVRAPAGWQLVHYTGQPRAYFTDAAGAFAVDVAPDHRVDLDVDGVGFSPTFLRQLEPGPSPTVTLRRGWSLSGRVEQRTNDRTTPVAHGPVSVRLPNERGLWYEYASVTDEQGRFEFPGVLPRAEWRVVPRATWQVCVGGASLDLAAPFESPVDDVVVSIKCRRR